MKKRSAKAAPKKTMMKRPSAKKAPQQMQQQAPPAPIQQAPQPPMGTPAPGSNGPMMKKGGVIKKKAQGGTSLTKSMPSLGAYKTGGKMKKAANGTTTSETTKKPSNDKYKSLGGEIGKPIFTNEENSKRRKSLGLPTSPKEEKEYYKKMHNNGGRNGKTMKKAANGTSLGMKSVKAGFDKNPGVTRADIITAAKGKAKSGAKMKMGGKIKKAQEGTMAAKMVGGALEPSAARIKSLQQKTAENVKKINMSSAADSMKKNMEGAAKSGGSMKKCKYGCK